MRLKETKKLLKKHKISPVKRLGQNFLINEKVFKKIIETAELSENDIVLEVGPGIGNLTLELAKRVRRIIAIEKDQKMYQILRELLEDLNIENVEIVKGDILKLDLKPYTLKFYKIVANIPYYLTAPLIRKFLEKKYPPKEMVLIVQKEIAQRICAGPPDMSLLAVSVQFYAKPEIISFVSKKSFWPSPKVDSAILRITQIHTDKKTDIHRFFKVVKAGFSQPRKQLINNLSKELKMDKPRSRTSSLRGKEKVKSWLLKNNIQPSQRAETLSIEDWINLTKSFKIKK